MNPYNKTLPNNPNIRYKIIREIGKGSFGTVYEIEVNLDLLDENSEAVGLLTYFPVGVNRFALKVGKFDSIDEEEEFLREYYIINELRTKEKSCFLNLLCYYLITKDEETKTYYFVSELMKGDLTGYIEKLNILILFFKKEDKKKAIYERLTNLFTNMIIALTEMHSKNIIHRDIKLQNILYQDNKLVPFKLGDFGLGCEKANIHFDEIIKCNTFVGTPNYIDPVVVFEFFETGKVKTASQDWDNYSLGIVFYEFWTFFLAPNKKASLDSIFEKIDEFFANPEVIKFSSMINTYKKLAENISDGLKEMEKEDEILVIYLFIKQHVLKRLNFALEKFL